MACSKCGGDYVVGEGGSLECGRCGYIVGDISLLLEGNPLKDTKQYPQSDEETTKEHLSKVHKDIRELV